MSLLTIAQDVARSVGIAVPTSVVGNTSRNTTVLVSLANEAGEELARRVDWGDLTFAETLSGTGASVKHPIAGLSRIVKGVGVLGAGGIVRPLSRAEWGTLDAVEGEPRYFLLEGDEITLWPYLATGQTATITYQTKNWCSNGTDAFAADDDSPLINEDLFAKALEIRWRRVQGMEYADQEAEFEAALVDHAGFDGRSRL